MRIHFREKPLDLLVVAIVSVALLASLTIEGPVRIVLGLAFVLLVPGYVLVAALFPSRKDLDWVERAALSVGLSIAVVPLLGLLLNFSPWGIRLVPMATAISLFIAGVGAAAYFRRMALPSEDRLSFTLELKAPKWKEYSALDKALTVGIAVSIIVAAGMLAYVATAPRPSERFTEFYILDANGRAEAYPTNLTAGEVATIIIGLVNREGKSLNYVVVATLEEYAVTGNASSAESRSLVSSSRVMDYVVLLGDGDRSESPLTFSVPKAGLFRLGLDLFVEGQAEPYRELHLWIKASA